MESNEIIKGFSIGDKVQLYPNDTYKKMAEILDCTHLGWSFKILPNTHLDSGYLPGDTIFISHQSKLTMKKTS